MGKIRLPVDILRRRPKWRLISYTRGSGQYPGGDRRYTGDQPPGLLIPCEDGTCQRFEIALPEPPDAD